jgi:segregation and condensation protein B
LTVADQKSKEVLELQIPTTLKSLFEALVFAAKEPLTVRQLKDIYEGEGPQAFLRQLDTDEIEAAVDDLNAEYEKAEKPYRIIRIAGGFQFATIASYAEWIGRLYKEQGRRKLSQSGIETLAIIAYKQPVTKADIESIRGVNCDYVLGTLLEKELTTVVGRAHAPGRPLLYGTTREFLKHFGLNEITDLPRPREIEEILGESQFETERRMLEAQAGAETMKEEVQDFKSRLPHIPRKKPGLETPVEIKPKDGQRTIKTTQKLDFQEEDTKTLPQTPEIIETLPVEPQPTQIRYPDAEVKRDEIEIVPEEVPAAPPPAVTSTQIDVLAEQQMVGPELPQIEAPTEVPDSEAPTTAVQDTVNAGLVPPELAPEIRSEHQQDQVAAAEIRSARTPGSVHKSRWQSWKEKVQGFIRKIFG